MALMGEGGNISVQNLARRTAPPVGWVGGGGGGALVVGVAAARVVPEGAQHRHTAQAQDRRLAEAVVVVSAIEMVGERLIPGTVFGQGGVEEEYGYRMPGDATHNVTPRRAAHLPA